MPESHFIPRFHPFLFLWGDLKKKSARKTLIKAIYDFTEIRTNGTGLNVEKMRPYCLLATEDKLDSISDKTQNYPEIIYELYHEFMKSHNGSLAIEKTAYYMPVSWDLLAKLMPNAKFIHVIRDGRDVVMSWKKTWFGPKNMELAAWLWAKHVREGISWGKKNPDRYLQLHYEDMTSNPEATLLNISSFIGIKYDGRDYDQSSLEWLKYISKNPHMTKIEGPIANKNFEKWRRGLTLTELASFEAIAGETLQEAGYTPAVPPDKAINKRWAMCRLTVARLASLFSTVEWKRRMVKLIPLAIWLTNKIGTSLPTILRKTSLVRSN